MNPEKNSTEKSERRKNTLFLILSGFFLVNAIVAEIIGVKIFSIEDTFGLAPAQLPVFGYTLDLNLTAGVLLWPFVFITTDIINEYFGEKGVRKISYITAAFIFYVFLVIYLSTIVSPASFWLEVNSTDAEGNPVNIDSAYNMIFLQSGQIIIASVIAFLLGQLLDAFVFHRIRKMTGQRMIWLRANVSTFISQLIDSYLILFLAFYALAPASQSWDLSMIFAVGTVNYAVKLLFAFILTPVIYIAHSVIDRYLGEGTIRTLFRKAT